MREHTSGVRSCPLPSSVFLPDAASWTIGSLSSPRRTTPIEMPGMEPFRLTSSMYERSCGESILSVWRNACTSEAGGENGACSPAHALHASPATKRERSKRREIMAAVADREAERDYALQEVSERAALRTELSSMTLQ